MHIHVTANFYKKCLSLLVYKSTRALLKQKQEKKRLHVYEMQVSTLQAVSFMTTFENSCNSPVNLFQNRFNRKKKIATEIIPVEFCNL